MSVFWAIVLAIGGIVLVIVFSEQLVKGVVGTSLYFNIPAFLLSVVFLGFDPENLGVGAIGSYESVSGIASGSIVGAAMVAIALALGISALFVPLKFKKVPEKILLIPMLSTALFFVLVLDQHLSRIDGAILLTGYALAVVYLIYLNKKGQEIKAGGEVAETLEKERLPQGWKSMVLMVIALGAIVGGGEMLVAGSRVILREINLSGTYYGMTILAFLVSVEEVARELPAALKGKPDITLGNVIGSVLAFFLFNAGVIALINPVDLSEETVWFFVPVTVVTVLFIVVLLAVVSKIPRWAGAVLILLYGFFVTYGYFLS